MSLTPEEYRDHLQKTGNRAGFAFENISLPRENDVPLPGMRLHYLEWGEARRDRPDILFLHGGGLNAHTWDLCCLALREDYHCIAMDQRGHGDSGWAEDIDYSLTAQRRDLEQFVERMGLDRFVLVGMSMGAICSLAYAPHNVAKLAALVVIDAGPTMRREGGRRIREFIGSFEERSTLEAIIERAMAFNPRRDPEILRRSLMHNLRPQPDGTWTWKYDRRRFAARDTERAGEERQALWDGIPSVTCPTLVVRGAESDVFHDEDAEKVAAAFPHGRWVKVPRAGHTVQGDNPKDLVAELRRFFAENGLG